MMEPVIEPAVVAIDSALATIVRDIEAMARPGLHPGEQTGTLGTMQPARTPGHKVSERKTLNPTPFQKALQRHQPPLSMPAWVATQKDLKLSTAASWCKRPGHGGRPVPRAWADRIAAEFGDLSLADPASWPNGIR